MKVYQSSIRLRHYGLLGETKQSKIERDLRLLSLELQDRPGDLYHLIELGRTLLQASDPKGHELLASAAEQLLPVRAAAEAPIPMVMSLLEYLLFVPPDESRSRLSRAEARELALRWFPRSAPLRWQLARNAFRAGLYREAADHLEMILHLAKTDSYDKSLSFNPYILGDEALMNLGACFHRLGDLDRAAACFQQLLGSATKHERASQYLAQVLAERAMKTETRIV